MAKKSTKAISPKVAEMVAGLEALRDTLAAGVPLEERFTVRRVEMIPTPRVYGPEDVRRVRGLLGMSQGVFARFMGVDVGTISAWEQGRRTPTGTARRLMEEIESNPKHWEGRVHALVKIKEVGPSQK
jgi:putative transcriptional regulator